VCPDCHGKGWIELRCAKEDETEVCGMCHGTGETTTGSPCQSCKGTGRLDASSDKGLRCVKCGGTGMFPIPEAL
jgi:DnaJ-class molecular chaperone